jgi:hypothetical protein
VPLPSTDNCPACPSVPSSGACAPSGLTCKYPGRTPSCECTDGQWQCADYLH